MKNKVLVVDDNPKNLQVVAALLSENNYKVEVAISGESALFWLEKTEFDAILLDVMMPGMDGFETCKRIKQNPNNKNVPIIFLTARHDIESITSGFNAGGVDYVMKPFNHEELLARLDIHIELKLAREKLIDVNRWLEKEVDTKTKELQKSNRSLEKANAELQKFDDSKNDFLKSISHEIRTPLNGIVGSLSLLRNYAEDPYFQEILSLLDLSVTKLEKYSYAALQIANLQLRGERYFGFQKVDLNALCKMCFAGIESKNKQTPIQFKYRSDCSEASIEADFDYLQNALMSLLECSMIFTHEGFLNMTLENREKGYHLLIEDSGSLFAGHEVSHFFDSINNQNYQFQRNNAMELHLAKIIIQLHGGSIKFGNKKENNGTRTKIFFPNTIK